jgi:hypothetical protein
MDEEYFSRKGAKAQRKPLETRQRFALLRLCARVLLVKSLINDQPAASAASGPGTCAVRK